MWISWDDRDNSTNLKLKTAIDLVQPMTTFNLIRHAPRQLSFKDCSQILTAFENMFYSPDS